MNLLIITIPLTSSLCLFTIGRFIGNKGTKIISIGAISLSTLISINSIKELIKGKIESIKIKDWFEIGPIKGQIELIADKESIIMNNLISIITTIVIIYSFWYLSEDAHINKFIAKLLLFSVAMFILVSSKNYLFSFLGWELVGIVSYLLINFWSISINNNKSAIKAIIFNKVGDIFYLLGLIILGLLLYSFDYNYINTFSSIYINPELYSYISFAFIIAAMAKSAQIFLHCWLGDAMAGPTPVSALLHAATMVTAGIFILLRSHNIIDNSSDFITSLILIIGSLTIIFAGLSALFQNDIKKIIAFSTCSQIGYMFFALGLIKPLDASFFHLITHGFFKALLFLSAGLIIHSFLLEQDLRKFGNFIFKAPLFYIFFFIGSLAIMGIAPLSGYYSKDLIIIHSLLSNNYSYYYYITLIIGSLLSSLYSIKILYYTFFNTNTISLHFFHMLQNYFFLFPFIFLLLGSLFLGFFTSSFFSSPDSINFLLEFLLYQSHSIYIFLPYIIPFFAFFLFCLYHNTFFPFYSVHPSGGWIYSVFILRSFYNIFNRRFLFDTLYNSFFVSKFFTLSYHFFFKFLDRGFLEFFGPISLFRLFYFFPKHFSLSNQLSSNLPFLFFYFFSSIVLFILSFLFLI